MDSPRPILPAELEFFNKGTGRGKSYLTLLSLGALLLLPSFHCQIATKYTKYQSTYSVLTNKHVLYSSFGGHIH